MSALTDKLRRARERVVEVAGRRFTLRRPTDAEAMLLGEQTGLDLVRRYITGWDLREIDLIPGGGPDPVPFDAALWADWVDDQPALWAPLAEAIVTAYREHADAREGAAKN